MQRSSSFQRSSPPLAFSALVLVVIATANTNNFFGYHAPGAVAESLQSAYHLDSRQFGLLFTVYSAPNVVLVFLGGLAIDKYGPAPTSLVFSFLMMLGMIIFAMAPIDHPMPYFIVGRLLLGFGESLCASIATMLGYWFKSSALTFAVGFNQAYVQLVGSALAFWLLPKLTLPHALWFTALVCAVSFFANVIYAVLHYSMTQYRPDISSTVSDDSEYEPIKHFSDGDMGDGDGMMGFGYDGSDDSDDELIVNGHSDHSTTIINGHIPNGVDTMNESADSDAASMSLWRELPVLFWLVALMITLLSPVLYTYTAYGPLYFIEKWHLTQAEAGSATSVLYVTIVFSPLGGWIIDKHGYRTAIQAVAAAFIPLWFVLLTFTNLSPYVGMTLLGLTYAVTENTGYSMVAYCVPEHRLGVAYGIVGCCVSFSLLFEPATVGWIREVTGSFFWSNVLFLALSVLGWLTAVWILWHDTHNDNVMSGPRLYFVQSPVSSEGSGGGRYRQSESPSMYDEQIVSSQPMFGYQSSVRRHSHTSSEDSHRHHHHQQRHDDSPYVAN